MPIPNYRFNTTEHNQTRPFGRWLWLTITTLLCFFSMPCFAYNIIHNEHISITWNQLPTEINDNIKHSMTAFVKKHTNKIKPAKYKYVERSLKRNLLEAIEPFGYFDPNISIVVTKVKATYTSAASDDFKAIIQLQKPIIITQFNLQLDKYAQKNHHFSRLLKYKPLQPGNRLETVKYQNLKDRLLYLANKYGYFNAKINKSTILINKIKHTAEIEIIFNAGKRYTINHIIINNSYLSKSFVKKYITLKYGEPFNNSKLVRLQNSLQQTGYFSDINFMQKLNHKNHNLNITLTLKPVKKQSYNIGAGYGTDTKFRTVLGFTYLPINRYGHSLSLLALLSHTNSTFNIKYTIPGSNPIKSNYSFYSAITKQDIAIGNAKSLNSGISFEHNYSNLKQNLDIFYLNETYNYNTAATNASMLITAISYNYNSAGNNTNPRNKILWNLLIKGSKNHALSNHTFAQANTNLLYMHTFFRSWRVIMRSKLGYTAISDIHQLPLSQQLLLGGPNTLRGYPYKSIGPGKTLAFGSAEVQKELFSNWYIGVFYDAGTISNAITKNWKQSIGPSIARMTPIGAVKLSFARPINDKNRHKWGIDFSIGENL